MGASQAIALVIDDDPALRLLIRVNLELDGFTVTEAGTVAEADAAIEAGRPDVILLDMHLGQDSSVPLLGRIRDAEIPVALVTGSVDTSEYASQADAILTKPFVPEKLVEIARTLARVGA